jgi:hypothetical protein
MTSQPNTSGEQINEAIAETVNLYQAQPNQAILATASREARELFDVPGMGPMDIVGHYMAVIRNERPPLADQISHNLALVRGIAGATCYITFDNPHRKQPPLRVFDNPHRKQPPLRVVEPDQLDPEDYSFRVVGSGLEESIPMAREKSSYGLFPAMEIMRRIDDGLMAELNGASVRFNERPQVGVQSITVPWETIDSIEIALPAQG